VSTFTSFLGRSYTQKQTFDTLDEFTKMEAKDLKAAPADWLPPGLFNETKPTYGALKDHGVTFSLVHTKGPLPSIQAVMEDGTRLTGNFTMSSTRIGKVTVEIVKPATAKAPASASKKDDKPKELIKPAK
jgi:hypothetical protein